MIKAILADVDGVMIGKQEKVNFPLPHTAVIAKLRDLSDSGMPVVLCTAKFHEAISGIITQASLRNPHITDGGALIIDPLGKRKIIKYSAIEDSVVNAYLAHDHAFTELYTPDSCYVKKTTDPDFIRKRSKVLQLEPVVLDRLADVVGKEPVIKIISFADDKSDIPRIQAQVDCLGSRINHIWTTHPFLMPRRICIMTAPGVSKEAAATEVLNGLKVSFDDVLGLGDSPADWDFMKLCGYVATIGKNKALKELAEQKTRSYIGGSVDDNGLLDILRHFGLAEAG